MALADALPPGPRAAFPDRLDLPGRLRQVWERWDDLPAGATRTLAGSVDGAEVDPLAVDRLLAGAPPEVLVHLMAATDAGPAHRAVSLYLSHLADVRTALSGKDLKALGLTPGPDYRKILSTLRDLRIEGKVHSREDELAWLRREGYAPEG